MINSFEPLIKIKDIAPFKLIVLNDIQELLLEINLKSLSENSCIDNVESYISISLVHKQDSDSVITLNIFNDYTILWYSSCNIRFDNEKYNGDSFKEIYYKCLSGDYEAIDYYFANKLIYTITKVNHDDVKDCITPLSLFYKIYFWMFKKNILSKKVYFKSFFN